MVASRVAARLIRIEDLPTLPQVVTRLVHAAQDERTSAADLTELVQSDHAISARILRLANSAYFGLRNRVDSMRLAIVVLGFDAVCELALATSVFNSLSQRKQFALDPEDFWMHSFGAAKAAQLIAQRLPAPSSKEGYFTASLLHDIGKYAFALILKDEYRAVVTEARELGLPLHQVEARKLQTTHTEVGRWIADRWRFPSMTKECIANLYRELEYTGSWRQELAAMGLADIIARRCGFGNAGDPTETEPERVAALLGMLQFSVNVMDRIGEELEELREPTRSFLMSATAL